MSQPKQIFADMLATLSSVQTFLGAANATEAAASIYVDELGWAADGDDGYTLSELQDKRPFILVSQGSRRRTRRSQGNYNGTLDIVMTAEKDPPEGYRATQTAFNAAKIAWDETVDAIEMGILSAAPATTLPTILDVEGSQGWSPREVHVDEGEFLGAEWTFTLEI